MQHIGGALKKLIKTAGLEKGIAQQKALEIWSETVGETISKKISDSVDDLFCIQKSAFKFVLSAVK